MRGMTSVGRRWLVSLLAMGALVLGCGGDDNSRHTGKHDIWFMGAVVDGATGTPINMYTLSLVSGTNTIQGKVDTSTGRFTVGPLQAWNDYGILISADGYRKFSSYNAGIAPPTVGANNSLTADIYSADTTQTFNFDAALFPTGIVTPNITVSVVGAMMAPLAGDIRLQPTSQPSLLNQTTEVGGQLWNNDNDLYAAAISGKVTNGTFTAMGTDLVYGVSYTVSVYNVDGYQPTNMQTQGNVQAGVNTAAMITLPQQLVPPPILMSNTAASCHPPTALTDTSSAVVTMTFNEAIADGTTTTGGGAEALDNGLSVSFSAFTSTLASNLSSTVQEKGTSFTISGNTLTLAWNPNVGLVVKGSGDTVRSVTYNLGQILIQPQNHAGGTSLSSLFGASTITCLP